jgi:hypothetical protein
MKERNHFGDLSIDVRIILKWGLKYSVRKCGLDSTSPI